VRLRDAWWILSLLLALVAGRGTGFAQTDEIQVYDASIAAPGKFNLMLHNNFTPAGLKTPAFPGGIIPDRSFNSVPEWAYGATDWLELGLYLPVYSVSKDRGGSIDGFKLRTLFVVPHADDRRLFYGVNFEFSVNATYWDPRRITSEVRPIIGWRFRRVDFIVNPILDTAYDGFKNLDFAPCERIAYNFSPRWATAVEEYADYGPLHQFYSANDQSHQVYAVVDHNSKFLDIEAGVGFGLTGSSDKLTLKLMLSRDLN
jgi:hypothetical protein